MLAFAKLRSLTELALILQGIRLRVPCADVVDALVPLTGLAELTLILEPAVVPAALGQLKGLRSLEIRMLATLVSSRRDASTCPTCKAWNPRLCARGCSMYCRASPLFRASRASVLRRPGTAVLCSACTAAYACSTGSLKYTGRVVWARLGRSRLPADMGALSYATTPYHTGHSLTQFPLALTQLVALERLDAAETILQSCPLASRPCRG